ncbi:MAG: hypothetical protein JNM62_04375 [Flavobacteriales bacterium]|nr:hypothetical protein [Flavobacteriales bacterium]
MRSTLIGLILLFCSPAANACINLIERIPGVGMEAVEFYYLGSVEIDPEGLHPYIKQKSAACGKRLGRACNDLVIAYLYDKQWQRALELSTQLVTALPNEYTVVITHAAALELNGRAADAVPYMQRALELNSGSHQGSEWIHLRLLKERVRGGTPDPWALIGVDLRPGGVLHASADVDLLKLVKQVHYQVNDRRFFTPEHDPLYGALLFVYADLLTLNNYASQAEGMYTMAAEYGFALKKENRSHKGPTTDSMPPAQADERSTAPAPAAPGTQGSYSALGLILVLMAAVAIGVFLRRRNRP